MFLVRDLVKESVPKVLLSLDLVTSTPPCRVRTSILQDSRFLHSLYRIPRPF